MKKKQLLLFICVIFSSRAKNNNKGAIMKVGDVILDFETGSESIVIESDVMIHNAMKRKEPFPHKTIMVSNPTHH